MKAGNEAALQAYYILSTIMYKTILFYDRFYTALKFQPYLYFKKKPWLLLGSLHLFATVSSIINIPISIAWICLFSVQEQFSRICKNILVQVVLNPNPIKVYGGNIFHVFSEV